MRKSSSQSKPLKFFAALMQQGVVPNEITYNALIGTCAKGNQVFAVMQQQVVVPDAITCSALISACDKGKLTESGLDA